MKQKKLGRKPIEVISSIPYSEIIFIISSGKNYAQIIAQERKTEPSPTVKQLTQLKDYSFIKSNKEKLLNKTVYSINWEKINEEFAKYILGIAIKKREQLKAYHGEKYNKYIEEQKKTLEKIETERYNDKISKLKEKRTE